MVAHTRKLLATALAFALVSASAQAEPLSAMLRLGPSVSPVLTEHSAGLRCLGELIDQSQAPGVLVFVRNIDDTTVPVLNEERRLSMGGAFVLQTALSRMESSRVQGVLNENAAGARRLVISGAWTQDDLQARETGVGVRGRMGDFFANLGTRRGYDFIAGDFASSVNGRVLLSTAVGVALTRRGAEARLVIDDGRGGIDIGVDRAVVQGPQMAQRRVLEAVALVHIAHYFDIDYRACLEASHTSPEAFVDALDWYEDADAGARVEAIERSLARLGYLSEAPDQTWSVASRVALMSFEMAKNVPPTGRPSAVIYALLVSV